MKILWFTNTVSAANEKLNQGAVSGGWIETLDKKLQGLVELNVAFYYKKNIDSFTYGKTKYYPIVKKTTFINRVLDNYLNRIESKSDLGKFLSIIDEVNPDLIHIHGTENPFGCIIPKTDVPVVVSIQGLITVLYQKYFVGMPVKLSKLKFGFKNNILNKSPYKKYKKFGKMKTREEETLKYVRYVIGRTDFDRRVTSIMAPRAKYFHLDEIMRSCFYGQVWAKNRDHLFVIHTTINPEFYKGLDLIAETIGLLCKHNFNFVWRVAGIGAKNPVIRAVSKKVRSQSWLKNVDFLGVLNGNELVTKLKEADVYVLSSHMENSPNSLCEAMLLGLPIVTTMVGGVASILENNKEGFIIQDCDPWSMAGAILQIYNNYQLSLRLGKGARRRAFKRHNEDVIIRNLVSIYNSIIEENRNDA